MFVAGPAAGLMAGAPTSRPDGALAVLRRARLIDLSHPLHALMPYFPARVPLPFERVQTVTLARAGVNSGRFSMSEHQGTHLDAPIHFTSGGLSADAIPVDHLLAEAVVIDLREAVAGDATYRLSVADIHAWEAHHGVVPVGCYALLLTGWSAHWSDPERYLGADATGALRHPACEPAAAELLVARGVLGVGIDTLSVDNLLVGEAKGASHKVLHGAGRYVLENLARLDELPPRGTTIVIGALPIVDGTAAPARVLAFVDD
jgi:kynurenine formamidase